MATPCRHINKRGTRCASTTLNGTDLCREHYRFRKRPRNLAPSEAAQSIAPELELGLGPISDRHSFQVALFRVLNEIAAGRIKGKRAGRALYCLQMIATNLQLTRSAGL